MSRSTRSSTKLQQNKEEEDTLMEDGFSVVDTDKKGKDSGGKAKDSDGKQQAKIAVEKMETDAVETKKEEQTNGGGDGNETLICSSSNGKGVVESVPEVPVSENTVDGQDEKTNDSTAKEEEKSVEEAKPAEEEASAEEAKPTEEKPEGKPAEEGENKEGEENKKKTEDSQEEAKLERKPKHPIVWVSNISRHVKATDLKKHFSAHGKVVTAKIVTNGKSFFGYVCLDSLEAVEMCVKNLDNSDFDGRKITVSMDKPLKDDKIIRKKGEDGGTHKDPLTTVYDENASDKKSTTGDSKHEDRKRKDDKRRVDTAKMGVEELRREVAMCEREIDRLRTRLIEEQARCRAEVKRARRMERELEDADAKIREDRKRFDRDREELVKKNRLEQLRLDADRVIMEREKEEMRRAREDFERDLRRFIEDQQQAAMDRRGPSPHNPSKRFRSDESPSEAKGPWMNDSAISGSSGGPSRSGGQFFGGNSSGGWSGPQGGSGQWRSVSGSGQGSFYRNDSFRPGNGGGSFAGSNDSGPGGFRSGGFDGGNRKF